MTKKKEAGRPASFALSLQGNGDSGQPETLQDAVAEFVATAQGLGFSVTGVLTGNAAAEPAGEDARGALVIHDVFPVAEEVDD